MSFQFELIIRFRILVHIAESELHIFVSVRNYSELILLSNGHSQTYTKIRIPDSLDS